MQTQVQRLLDLEAIRNLVHIYCRAADRHDHKLMRELYHEDALDDHGSFFKGLAMDFIDKLPEIQAPMEILHHNTSTHNIELDGDKAEGEVYVIAFHRVALEKRSIDLIVGGRYLDKYEKREGVWKFSHRAGLADWTHIQDPSSVDFSHPLVSGALVGQAGLDDPSYSFFQGFTAGKRSNV
ncbi:nuclear transport factor 2 family protein [Parahaliea sp. F7430]|uniref:Nuclear transport factor 2 family protein n=1 Tax=Sediminihaliea albiluteola TaxID=2758564 RepID=A0A7W2YK36_9GAMM|nr:nuclear transport factor 2 family protein [Sediminihaliea albiluteola]MBA6413780.1 nuclear transport factor 2 family protein [Sediminihaliea albiluteola]